MCRLTGRDKAISGKHVCGCSYRCPCHSSISHTLRPSRVTRQPCEECFLVPASLPSPGLTYSLSHSCRCWKYTVSQKKQDFLFSV